MMELVAQIAAQIVGLICVYALGYNYGKLKGIQYAIASLEKESKSIKGDKQCARGS